MRSKKNRIAEIIGKDNFGMERGNLVACSLAINILSLALPITTLQIYDRIIANGNESTLNVLAIGVCVAIVLESVLRMLRSYVTGWAGAAFEHRISCEAMRHLLKADIDKVEKQSAGEYLGRMAAIAKLREFYSGYALMTLIDLPFVFLFLGLIAYLAGSLVVVPLLMLGAFVAIAWRVGKSVKYTLAKRDLKDEERYNFILETLSGIHTVKSGAYESIFLRKYEMLQRECSEANYKVALFSGKTFNYGYLFTALLTTGVVAYGASMAISGALSMGTLVACVLLSGRVMQPVQRAMALWTRYQDYDLAKEQANSLFHLPVSNNEKEWLDNAVAGTVDIENLSFSFGGNRIINNINLHLAKGESIAITSDASNGKTTFLKLVCGVYQPSFGNVKIDGVETKHYCSNDLVSHIGYLSTQGVIYRGTIFDNLTRFGRTPSEKAFELAELLGIENEVAKLPNGYNTMLEGTTADNIPPGLKQRIAMARVLACKPKVILFDHADRALDREGYNQIYKLLGRLKGRVTMIIISSDRNLLRLCDRGYKLQDGTLVENQQDDENNIVNVQRYREARI